MQDIKTLLQRRAEGLLSPEEEQQLNQLTHRDEVVARAMTRAGVLRRRQMLKASSLAVALLAVTASLSYILRPSGTADPAIASSQPMVAQADPKNPAKRTDTPQPRLLPTVERVKRHAVQAEPQPSDIVEPEVSTTDAVAVESMAEEVPMEISEIVPQTIVVCNTQCAPDSVISGIWQFLKA